MGKVTKNLTIAGAGLVTIYGVMNAVAKRKTEDKGIDDDNPHINSMSHPGEKERKGLVKKIRMYENRVKPVLDKVLSFGGLVVLSPLFLVISLAVFVDDPGPIFFTQKRIGKDKHYVMIHKFRSMAISTPHDVPTHQLNDPDKYITKVGRVLRKTSLDELPQIWDIFRGRMSVIGPRPALWNQDDLVAERDKYSANNVMPGLTGLAQIRGRDELEISEKAKFDGEYVKILRNGGVKAFLQDVKCFVETVASVINHNGVVEGGTGSLSNSDNNCQVKTRKRLISPTADEAGFEEYGFRKTFHINKSRGAKVLITGAKSYVGESFTSYCKKYYSNIETTTIDMKDDSWRKFDFSGYDTVFHVAGIAHADIGKVTDEQKKLYYTVNADLAIETAKKAKESGVKQFIYMSSMIIYGKSEYINETTIPDPVDFYGDSKWRGDLGVRKLASKDFRVAVLRPPMVYGRGSKGNYSTLSMLVKILPFFPDYDNKRSMLYVENLCEFVSLLTLSGEGGIYFPQNGEYSRTSSMAKSIAAVAGKHLWETKLLSPVVRLAKHVPGKASGFAEKAFGNSYYSQMLSTYDGLVYSNVSLEESIRRTKNVQPYSNSGQKKALMLASVASMIDLFNTDNIGILISLGYQVDVAANFSFGSITSQERVNEYKQELISRGIGVYDIPIPRALSMVKEMNESYHLVKKLVDTNHYNLVHCHSPIGGVLCRLACRKVRRKYGTKVIYTAHGFHFFKGAGCRAWMLCYPVEKICSRFTDLIITINHEDYKAAKGFRTCKAAYVPGIGVHVEEIKNVAVDRTRKRAEFGFDDTDFVFMSTGQISVRKNHEVVIRALSLFTGESRERIKYLIVGFGEEEDRLKRLVENLRLKDCVIFAGYRSDVKELLHAVDAFAFPSIQEGLPVALMEAMAVGLPIVASRIRGNIDLIKDGVNGFLVEYADTNGFAKVMERIAFNSNVSMKIANEKSIKAFDVDIVNKKMSNLYRSVIAAGCTSMGIHN